MDIIKDNLPIAELGSGFFIGEMSFLQEGCANATAKVISKQAQCIEWERETLNTLKVKNAELYIKLEQAIAFNLIQKINHNK